jgi:glycosyltransferase involved in cell wall biosynthesis
MSASAAHRLVVTCVANYPGKSAWGADRSFVETLQELRVRGLDCRVIFPVAGGMGYDLVRAAGFPVEVVSYSSSVAGIDRPVKRRLRNLRNRWAALRIGRIARAWGSDLIYSNTLSTAVGVLASRTSGIPHVWHLREFGQEDHGWVFDYGMRAVTKWVRESRGIVANSHAVADKFAKLTGRRDITVVHNAVRLREPTPDEAAIPLKPLPDDVTIRCALSGRFAEGKGQLEAIEAIAELDKRGVRAGLWLVGDGERPFKEQMEQAIERHGLSGRVVLVGYVPNPVAYLRAADVVLVCSRAEAFGRATVEGMLAGRPVVATASGGTPELIDHGRTGLLYQPGDVNGLAEQIASLAADPERARSIGRSAAAYADNAFAPSRYADELLTALTRAAAPVAVPTAAEVEGATIP